jgi:3'(2'), 5'-bisphosphate nucleotidase
MKNPDYTQLMNLLFSAAIDAGKEILKIYDTDFAVDYKEDESPLTLADQMANNVITDYLEKTGIPVLSEEGKHLPYAIRKNWDKLWIVDPLDGTKEFVKRNGEFTVNIALVEDHQPKMGIIFCPVLNILYYADPSSGGAFITKLSDHWPDEQPDIDALRSTAQRLPIAEARETFTVVASRSHLNDETKLFVSKIEKQTGKIQFISRGSSLKLCMVAEGKADLYPRFAPTSEWDTAAGQAIVEHAGGSVILPENGKPMSYNKENILNPWFLVIGKDVQEKIEI